MSKYYFYIVRCKNSSLYSGITTDLAARIKDHNSGKGGKYTRRNKPVKLVYHEECPDISGARKREYEVKNWRKEKKEALIAGFPRPKGLGTNAKT